jgi:acyl-CoA reductase-like NAD-dependent aldehyde dehydrogenase
MPQYPELQLLVAGDWKSADGAPVMNPADESILGTVPHPTRADLDAALSAAEQGFRVWRRRLGVDLAHDRLARQAGAVRSGPHPSVDLGRNDDLVSAGEILH